MIRPGLVVVDILAVGGQVIAGGGLVMVPDLKPVERVG